MQNYCHDVTIKKEGNMKKLQPAKLPTYFDSLLTQIKK